MLNYSHKGKGDNQMKQTTITLLESERQELISILRIHELRNECELGKALTHDYKNLIQKENEFVISMILKLMGE